MELFTILYAFMSTKLGLHGAPKEVFAVIFGFWRREKKPVKVANSVIQDITGLSRATVVAAKNQLISRKLISVDEIRGKPSLYEVLMPPDLAVDWTGIDILAKVSENQTGRVSENQTGLEFRTKTKHKTYKRKEYGNKSIITGNQEEFERPDRI